MAAGSIYESARMAAGYALQPAARASAHRPADSRGRSAPPRPWRARSTSGAAPDSPTAALAPMARSVVGLEPVRAMLIAPPRGRAAGFIRRARGRSNCRSQSGCFNLVTAAGSLNYVDLEHVPPGGRARADGARRAGRLRLFRGTTPARHDGAARCLARNSSGATRRSPATRWMCRTPAAWAGRSQARRCRSSSRSPCR
ncbi:MAG: hypothetical protein MZW92_40425 [Comamonadaceae bacterium]|nr:hypothetical protein [Comamonadaceae bacterium]